MLNLDLVAYRWLKLKPSSQWSKSHFQKWIGRDMLLNNQCESFDGTLLNVRELLVLTMLEEIRVFLIKKKKKTVI